MSQVYFRQGDILLKQVDESAIKDAIKLDTKTIALGEQTGHHHTFNGQVQIFRKKDSEQRYAQVLEEQATLTHQEHKHFTVPKGTFEVIHEREYNAFERNIERVRD